MKIETKFNVGDEVEVLDDTKLKKRKIHSIKVDIGNKETEIEYFFKIVDGVGIAEYHFEIAKESKVFANEEDFLNQLKDNIIEMEIDFNDILKKIKDDE